MNMPKLKGIIAEKGIDQKTLCVIWGNVSRQTVSCKINGKVPITLDEAKKFSDYAKLTNQERIDIFLT